LWFILDSLTDINKAFQLVDKGLFRHLLTYLQPSLSDKDIPHRQTLHNEIINKANLSEARLKELLKVRPIVSSKRVNIQSDARMSPVRCHSPTMPGHHRSATRICLSQDILSMVWIATGNCTQSSLRSPCCQAAIRVRTLAM
jgi:hypothetical protein